MNLFFIRSSTGTHSADYYDKKTEAIVVGDIDGFFYLIESLKLALRGKKCVNLDKIKANSNSMSVLICPANSSDTGRPKLRIIERPIFKNKFANMQLVFSGNKKGLRNLLKIINKALATGQKKTDVIDDHLHLDDESTNYLLPRSVSLNIRYPFQKWSKKSLGPWYDVVYQSHAERLPSELSYLFADLGDYEDPDKTMIQRYLNQNNAKSSGGT